MITDLNKFKTFDLSVFPEPKTTIYNCDCHGYGVVLAMMGPYKNKVGKGYILLIPGNTYQIVCVKMLAEGRLVYNSACSPCSPKLDLYIVHFNTMDFSACPMHIDYATFKKAYDEWIARK